MEYLSKLAVGDTFETDGIVYIVVAKPFGKFVEVRALDSERVQRFNSSFKVNPIAHKETFAEDRHIDGYNEI